MKILKTKLWNQIYKEGYNFTEQNTAFAHSITPFILENLFIDKRILTNKL